jgi:putative oxidoreductase
MKNLLDLIGRILLSFIFLYDAFDSIFYIKATRETMISYGLTWRTDLLLYGGIFVLVLGGLMLLAGYRTRLAVILLLMYWVPVTLIAHSFWNYSEPERRIEAILFMKNLAITGSLLLVWANGTGKYSIKRLFATTRVPGA